MQNEEVEKLVEKYLQNTASKEEVNKLFRWYRTESSRELEWHFDHSENEESLKLSMLSKIIKSDLEQKKEPLIKSFYYTIAAAASIIILFSYAFYNYISKDNTQLVRTEQIEKQKPLDIQPGGHIAILTLADGRKIVLDDSHNGVLVNEGGIKVHKNLNGILEYTLSKQAPGEGQNSTDKNLIVYNTIQTPVGGKFQLNLSDGSKVWLNSASSLRFPVVFTDNTREVELKGEAYFEVSKDNNKKFSVRSGNQSVEVLGTHFNINAYSDEPSITTTLIEGKVRVIELNTHESQILEPGEQSKVDRNIKIKKTDTQVDVAWKDGYFYFENADIKIVMRQLARWYGITTRYEGVLPEHHFAGAISTSLTLLEVLEILEKSNIHFRLEGKEVIVMP